MSNSSLSATRILKLQQELKKSKTDAVIVMQKMALFYFTGTLQQGLLFVPQEGDALFFVKKDLERAKEESFLTHIYSLKSFNDIPPVLAKYNYKTERIGLESDVVPFNIYKRIYDVFPSAELVDASYLIRKIRVVKDETEIELLKRSGELIGELFAEFKKIIKVGMRELDVAYELEYLARKKGHMGIVRMRSFNQEMFYGHLLSGKNGLKRSYVESPTAGEGQGAYFSQGAGNKRLKENESFSVDFVFNYCGYLVDMTRIFYLGKPDDKYLGIYNVAKKIHEEVEANIKPGITCDELTSFVMDIVSSHDLEHIFMGLPGKTAPYIGHGVGLELDELPILTKGVQDEISENVVFALEPKFFVPDYGIAGIENTYVMTKDGVLLLTKYPNDIQIIL